MFTSSGEVHLDLIVDICLLTDSTLHIEDMAKATSSSRSREHVGQYVRLSCPLSLVNSSKLQYPIECNTRTVPGLAGSLRARSRSRAPPASPWISLIIQYPWLHPPTCRIVRVTNLAHSHHTYTSQYYFQIHSFMIFLN